MLQTDNDNYEDEETQPELGNLGESTLEGMIDD
jgi:hypothetical protein